MATVKVHESNEVPGDPPVAEAPAAALEDIILEFPDGEGGINRVLDRFTLEIGRGEFVALVGKSGSGKTTALSLLAGLLTPDAGRVTVLGRRPVEARRDVGYMLARDALLPWRTAQRNVEVGLDLRKVPRGVRRSQALRALDDVGLTHAAKRFPAQLSHGMRQRVAIARTMVTEPDLLLMDEPFAALDAQTREFVRNEFLRVWEEHRRSVCFVTHDLAEALLLADRVVLLGHGRIATTVEVPFDRPRVAEEIEVTAEFRELIHELRNAIR